MIKQKIRSALLNGALFLYNAAIFVSLNILLWRNHAWNEKRWTKVKPADDLDVQYRAILCNK
ncbi:MAG: hypothetical protein V2A66_10310 [Pseudomonadota bacterium]